MNILKRIDQILKLRVRTMDRGASVAEEESAATAIGRILMRETKLIVTGQESTKPPKLEKPKPAVVILEDVTVNGTTRLAILCGIPNFGEAWIPRSQIRDGNEIFRCGDFGRLVISSWLAKKKGILAV